MPASNQWRNATTDQKLEMLRQDIERVYDAVNKAVSQLRATDSKLSEVAGAVEKLERQMRQIEKK